MSAIVEEFAQDGDEAKQIAAVIPYYKFHGVPRFYDISGMCHLSISESPCIMI